MLFEKGEPALSQQHILHILHSCRPSVLLIGATALALSATPVVAGDAYSRPDAVSLFELFSFGWQINLVLLVMFVIALFLVFFSILTTRRRKVMPLDQMRKVQDYVSAGNIEQAINLLQIRDTLFSRTILPGLKLHSHSHDRISAAMEAAGRRALGGFRQHINYIANLGTLAPMLGLLGTVLGLTKAFNAMGNDDPLGTRSTLMTASIGEAMGTTVVGLLVGIPAMAAYYLCLSRLGRLSDDLEAVTEEIAVALVETSTSPAPQLVEAEEAGTAPTTAEPSDGTLTAAIRSAPNDPAESTSAGED